MFNYPLKISRMSPSIIVNTVLKRSNLLRVTLFAVTALLFTSCSEDPPTTTGNTEITFDSARFNWSTYILYETGLAGGPSGCLWAEDTNNVF